MGFTIASDPSGSPLAVLDVRGASATIIGTPHTFVPYALVATSGTFAPAGGEIEIGATGSIVLASTFTASGPAVSPATATLSSGSMASPISAATVALAHLGSTVPNGMTPPFAGDRVGTQVTQSSGPYYLKRIGVMVGAGTNAYLGVYADAGNVPGSLLTSIGPVALSAGLNELAITHVPLPTTFWVVTTFETAVSLSGANSISTDRFYSQSAAYGPLPTSLPSTSVGQGLQFMQYVQAAHP
jgi:hypothetical protein